MSLIGSMVVESAVAEQAYLVIREGSKWSDVLRLAPGDPIKIGRDPTSQIVIRDDRCSRTHAELFMREDQWILRDLGSRNGTAVGKKVIKGDWTLRRGDVIRIGHSRLVFAYDLSEAFSDPTEAFSEVKESVEATDDEGPASDSNVLTAYEPTTITHRRGQTRFLSSVDKESELEGEVEGVSRTNRATAQLCRLAFELGKAPDIRKLADMALAGLLEGANVDAGALLLLPRDFSGEARGSDLEVFASLTTDSRRYHPVAGFLATTVMREGEAVLARNIMGDSSLGSRDSKGVIHATSVICAPVRHASKVLGLIHLYSSSQECVPDPDDLEFTLAVADTVAVAIGNLNRRRELAENLTQVRNENLQLRQQLGVQSEIVGSSQMMRQVAEDIDRAAASKATLLIRGESGVGKELVARAVHFSSARSKKVFVCLNCAALSEDLLASELFGHERGAFTGATDRKIGKFEAAHGGTLMLDEIGEMSPGIQAKFLRVLEGHPFERVGGNKPVKAEVRVIAATNRDLEREVAKKRFRHDLFFRLRVLEIVVPPLRKRPDDIAELALYFLEVFRSETGRKILGFSPSAMELLTGHRWPGNVRELKNVVERAVVLCRGEYIERGDLLLSSLSTSGDTGEATAAGRGFEACSLSDLERRHILATLNHVGWNKSRTAGILGIERSTLDRKIRRYKLVNEHGMSGRGKAGKAGPSDGGPNS